MSPEYIAQPSKAVRLRRPEAPSDLTATLRPTRKPTVLLRWRDNSRRKEGFRVEARIAGTSGFQILASVPANRRRAVLRNLEPATTYIFKVRAFNATRRSGVTNLVRFTTPE